MCACVSFPVVTHATEKVHPSISDFFFREKTNVLHITPFLTQNGLFFFSKEKIKRKTQPDEIIHGLYIYIPNNNIVPKTSIWLYASYWLRSPSFRNEVVIK